MNAGESVFSSQLCYSTDCTRWFFSRIYNWDKELEWWRPLLLLWEMHDGLPWWHLKAFKGHCTFPNEPHQYRINKNHRLAVSYSHSVQHMDSERDEGIGPFSFPPFFFLFFLFLHYFLPVRFKNFISFLINFLLFFLQMYQNVFSSPHSLGFYLFFCHFFSSFFQFIALE